MARTEAKKEGRDGQERSLRGTVSVDKGMAMKRVVWDCLCGVSGIEVDEAVVDDEGGRLVVKDVVVVVVGVESREGLREEAEGVVCCWGDERMDWDVESWGEVGFVGFEDDAWRLRLVAFEGKCGSAGVCAWCRGRWAGGGASAMFSCGCLLLDRSLAGSVGVWCALRVSTALSSWTVEVAGLSFLMSSASVEGF